MKSYPIGSSKAFHAYSRSGDFDLESGGTIRKSRKPKTSFSKMIKSLGNRLHHMFKLHPVLVFVVCVSFGITVLILVSSIYGNRLGSTVSYYKKNDLDSDGYPFANLKNLVMVAGHSVYTSSDCGKVEKEDSWFLESYQKNPGQAATFLSHIQEGVEAAAKDDESLLLFSGGETRKDAGPRSEAQSYWAVAESKGWFGESY